ncbi:hypothetical protein MTO96_015903 [Rhipicephalus appendiculatus]
MTNLREFVVLGCSAAPMILLDAICLLLVDTMCLITLSMPGLVFDGRAKRGAPTGGLESFDISACRWRNQAFARRPRRLWTYRRPAKGSSRLRGAKLSLHGFMAFDHTACVELPFLDLSFVGLRPHDLWALFNTTITVETVQVISLRGVSRQNLRFAESSGKPE